jgi:hypothetical protein
VSDAVKPIPGDIWSSRFSDRRVKVLNVLGSGRVQVKGVLPAGSRWTFDKTSKSSSVSGARFPQRYRLLVRGAA